MNLHNPGKQLRAKINMQPKLCKLIFTYNPEFTDTLVWTQDEKMAWKAASISDALSDKIFALWLLARKLEGKDQFDMPKIILPGQG